MQYLDSKLSLPLLTNFDVKKQMVSLLETYGRVTPRQAALFNQLVQEQKVVRYIPEFCDISYLMKEIDNDTKQKYQMKTDEVLNEVLSVDVYPNKKLAELLKDNPIIFYYTEHDSTDAAVDSIFQNGKRRPVMILDRGLLREDNKELLVGIMCHELGHWLDDSSRSDNFYGEIRLAEECFADMVGYKMAKNAGYDMSFAVEKRKIMAKEQRAYCKAENKPLPEKTIFEKRIELLEQAFGNDETSKSNMVVINRLSGLKKER